MTRKANSYIITIILSLGLALSLQKVYPFIGFVMVFLGLLLSILYAVFTNRLSASVRIMIIGMAIIPLVMQVFVYQHYPYVGTIHLLLIIPIALFAYISFRAGNKLKIEFPFLMAIALVAIFSFL